MIFVIFAMHGWAHKLWFIDKMADVGNEAKIKSEEKTQKNSYWTQVSKKLFWNDIVNRQKP